MPYIGVRLIEDMVILFIGSMSDSGFFVPRYHKQFGATALKIYEPCSES